jgi:hypothetical protein
MLLGELDIAVSWAALWVLQQQLVVVVLVVVLLAAAVVAEGADDGGQVNPVVVVVMQVGEAHLAGSNGCAAGSQLPS